MPSFYRWRNRGAKSQRCAGHRGPKARRLDLSLGLSNSRSHSLSIYTKPSISHKENSVSNSLHTRQALNLSLAIYFPAFLLRNVPIVTTLEEYFCLVFVSNQISLLFCLICVFFASQKGSCRIIPQFLTKSQLVNVLSLSWRLLVWMKLLGTIQPNYSYY